MSTSHPISPADAAWLQMDRPANLMIVNSVLWFDEPVDWDSAAPSSSSGSSRASSATASPRRSTAPGRSGRST